MLICLPFLCLLAGYKFVNQLISAAFEGKTGIVEPSYVYIKGETSGGAAIKSEIGQDLEYFSVPVELGVSLHRHYHSPQSAHAFGPCSLMVSRKFCPLGAFPLTRLVF